MAPTSILEWASNGLAGWAWRRNMKPIVSDPRNASLVCWANAVKRGMGQGWLTHQHCWEIRLEAAARLLNGAAGGGGPAGEASAQPDIELAAWREWGRSHVVGKGDASSTNRCRGTLRIASSASNWLMP